MHSEFENKRAYRYQLLRRDSAPCKISPGVDRVENEAGGGQGSGGPGSAHSGAVTAFRTKTHTGARRPAHIVSSLIGVMRECSQRERTQIFKV